MIVNIAYLEQTYGKEVVELAKYLSLAVRIEPELVGAVRRSLTPHLTADNEAQFWFSPINDIRSTTSVVLKRKFIDTLRTSLLKDPKADAAWSIIEKLHEEISPALHSEESLTWYGLKLETLEAFIHTNSDTINETFTDRIIATKQIIDKELEAILDAFLNEKRMENLSYWLSRASRSFPKSIDKFPRFGMLLMLHQMVSGNTLNRKIIPSVDYFSGGYASHFYNYKQRLIGVLRKGDTLYLGAITDKIGKVIRVPDIEPCIVRVNWVDDNTGTTHTDICQIPKNEVKQLIVGFGPITISGVST
jgi:hypothetical protein